MNIRKNPMERRTVLRGLGTAIALPLLDAMVPAKAASASALPLRLSIFYMPNGMIMEHFVPQQTGKGYELSATLKPLEKLREQFTVISGLAHFNATALGDGPGDHGRACASYLTGMHPKKTEGYDLSNGTSMDQYVARQFGKETQIASLELGLESPGMAGSCDSGYSCAYTNTMSWSNRTTPLPTTVNPRDVFERLFGDGDKIDQASRRAQVGRQSSILDFVLDDAARMTGELGADDKRKLDEYTTSVRDLERRLQKASASSGNGAEFSSDLTRPPGIPESFSAHARAMIDLQVLAMRADLTRVSSLMVANEISNRSYTEIGISDSHHAISHHGRDPEKMAKLQLINSMFMDHFAYYLKQLSEAKEGNGTLLDRTLAWAGASMGDPNQHDHMYLPTILAGGLIKGNRHIVAPKDTPMANLLVSAMNLLGVDQQEIGNSTGPFSQLDA